MDAKKIKEKAGGTTNQISVCDLNDLNDTHSNDGEKTIIMKCYTTGPARNRREIFHSSGIALLQSIAKIALITNTKWM
jgi:hypothetical protein